MTFNPDADGVLGLQWPVTVESAYAVDSPTKAAGARVRSHGAETIDKASMYAAAVAGSAGYLMEVWPVTVTESPEVTTFTARPNEDVVVTTLNRSAGAASVGNAYPEIDDSILSLTDWLTPNTSGTAEWAGRVATGSGNFTGEQILRLEVHVVAANDDPTSHSDLNCYVNIGGTKYLAAQQNISYTQTEFVFVWEYNPATGLPWTIADIEAFDTSDEIGFSWSDGGSFNSYIYQAWAEIDHVPEQRLAFGKATITTVGWQEFNLTTPTGGGTWSKADATDYLFTVRRISGTGSASFRYLDSLADCPHEHSGYAVQFSGAEGRLLELGAEFTRAHALIITTSAPATSADSQPYASLDLADVYTGHSVEQEFTGVAANYGVVKAVVAAQAGTPSADLNIKIRRRSDNVQIGTTMVFTPAELTGTPTTLREITVRMAAAALTAVQEYVEFTSSAPDGQGWVVVLLDTTGTGSSATYGGTTDVATVGGAQDNDTDLAVVVAQIPTAPANLTVTTETAANGHEYLRLTWDQTGLSASFGSYQIERDDDGTWRPIAAISTESVEEFDDYESRRGIEASYRLRVVHVNGIASDWTATGTGTAG